MRWVSRCRAAVISRSAMATSAPSSASRANRCCSDRYGFCRFSHSRAELTTASLICTVTMRSPSPVSLPPSPSATPRSRAVSSSMIGCLSLSTSWTPIVATLSLMAASACSLSCRFTSRIGSTGSPKSSLRYAMAKSWMIHCTYACTSTPCSSLQMQNALMRIVCIAPGTTRYESVNGLYRNETPSPTCSGSARPRRVCTTNAFGGTTTVFQRPNPVIRTSTAPDVAWLSGGGPRARARFAIAPGGGGGAGAAGA